MNRPLAGQALALIPVMALVFALLTRLLPPVSGFALGLAIYWVLLIVALRRHGGWSLVPRRPGLVAIIGLLILLALAGREGWAALPLLSPHVLALVLILAAMNGLLEEAFWRGALMSHVQSWRQAWGPGLIFTAWHLAPLAGAIALMPPRDAVLRLVGGAALLAIPATAARLGGGTAGAGGIGHALINVLTFAAMAAHPQG